MGPFGLVEIFRSLAISFSEGMDMGASLLLPDYLAVDDFVHDDGNTPAVVGNGLTLAHRMGYDRPDLTTAEAFTILVPSGFSPSFDVKPGMFYSAILSQWLACGAAIIRGENPMIPDSRHELEIDDRNRVAVLSFVERYMGARICREAWNNAGQHPFLNTLLGNLDGRIGFRIVVCMRPADE